MSDTAVTLTHGSLFAGYGGLNLAIEDVFGAHTVWVSEWEAAPSRVLAHHWPDAPNLGDVTAVDWASVEPVDIISGGSPCQDLSHAGRRAGMTEGTRSNLWVAMREAIAVLRPTFVVWENVRGAMSAEATSELEHCPGCMGDPRDRGPALRALGRVLGDLADLGYDAQWHGLRVADLGGCHGRWRVFVLAYSAGVGRERLGDARFGRPGPADGGGGTVALLPTPRATDGTKGGPNQRGSSGDLMLPSAVMQLLPTPATAVANDGEGTETWLARRERVKLTAANGNGMGGPGEANGEQPVGCGCSAWGHFAPSIHRQERAFGRVAPPPTEVGPSGKPRLSPRAAEWMMGLPAGWVTDRDVTRNAALKMLGNGVVPAQAAHALRVMLARAEAAA